MTSQKGLAWGRPPLPRTPQAAPRSPRSQLSPESQDPMMMDGTWPWHRTLALRYPHRRTPLLEESVCCYKRTTLNLTANGPGPAWIQVPARNSPPTDSHGFDEEPGLQPKHIRDGWNFLPLWKCSTNIFLLDFCPFTSQLPPSIPVRLPKCIFDWKSWRYQHFCSTCSTGLSNVLIRICLRASKVSVYSVFFKP